VGFEKEHTHFEGFPRIRIKSSLVIKPGEGFEVARGSETSISSHSNGC
jgi:hypothetical protein